MKKTAMLVFILFVFFSSLASAANWEWLISTDEDGYYYDTESIHFVRSYNGKKNYSLVEYWLKHVYTPASAAKLVAIYGDDCFYDVSHSLQKERIDSSTKQFIYFGGTIFYNSDGEVIYSTESIEPFAVDIIPDSIGEAIYYKIVYTLHD